MTDPGRLWLLIPGDPSTPTGGYAYDRRVIEGLDRAGWSVELERLDASFPHPTRPALDAAARALALIPDGATVVVDGLAFGRMAEIAAPHQWRLRLVALVHHPLALETGLDPIEAERLRVDEQRALALARALVTTSPETAALLVRDYQVAAERVRVVEPGTDPAPLATGSGGPWRALLCVAAVTPRKGHDLLLEALAALQDRDWRLDCVGSLDRSPETARALQELTARLCLDERVTWHGAVSSVRLAAHYRAADLFVLPTRFEGYGMVLTEALAHGLPILSTRTGPVSRLVPPEAGILVPPDDPGALQVALARLMDDPPLRARLSEGARAARVRLRAWEETTRDFAHVLEELSHG